MKLNRIMIAAPKSGSGKTTITCALLQILKDMGQNVVAYKCGPDYIDPMFHQKVIDIPSKNLDTFFTGEEETRKLFLENRNENEFAVLEGVMGLFDGLGGMREEGSTYHLAKVTKTPIILVVDAKGMGPSIIPLIYGFLEYDKEHLIKGVILNRMSKSYYETIKPIIEEELDVAVIGYFPDYKQFHIESRHLGLMLPHELENIKEQLKEVSEKLQNTVSMEKVIQIASEAKALEDSDSRLHTISGSYSDEKPIIAVARDEAFCFYYEDNIRLLQEYGAQIEYFSPIHDKKLPRRCSGILLGGGYPELYGEELSRNTDMLKILKSIIQSGIPVVAECGGFMYLHRRIVNKENQAYPMVGVIPADCYYTGKLVRFGYIELMEKEMNFLASSGVIKGHEFHYYDSEMNGEDCLAIKPITEKSYSCVISKENCFIGFPHLYYPSNPTFAEKFVEKSKEYKR